jgi:hypothetical protein
MRHSPLHSSCGLPACPSVWLFLQAWLVEHPPRRVVRGRLFSHHPCVHYGFLRSWQTNGLNDRVLGHLRLLFESGAVDKDCASVYVTGACGSIKC